MTDARPRRRGFGRRAARPDAPDDADAARLAGIGLLARRDFARRSLAERLVDRGYEPAAAEAAVAALQDERLLDDARFVTHRLATHVARGHGPLRIRAELARAGLDRALIDAALRAAAVDWTAEARRVLIRKYGDGPAPDAAARAARIRFLCHRGYPGESVRAAVEGADESDIPAFPDEADLALDTGGDVDL